MDTSTMTNDEWIAHNQRLRKRTRQMERHFRRHFRAELIAFRVAWRMPKYRSSLVGAERWALVKRLLAVKAS